MDFQDEEMQNKDCRTFIAQVITPACNRIARDAFEFQQLYQILDKCLKQEGTGFQRLFDAIWEWKGVMVKTLQAAAVAPERKYRTILNMVSLLEACQAGCIESDDINARYLGLRIQMTKYNLCDACAEFIPGASRAELAVIDLIPTSGMKCTFYGEANFSMAVSLKKQHAPDLGGGMIFTELRRKEELDELYSDCKANREELQRAGIYPRFQVDATLGPDAVAPNVEKVVFMFPHMSDENRGSTGNMLALLCSFLFSCMEQLPLRSQVYITFASQYYVNRWLKPILEKNPELRNFFDLRYVDFQTDMFPGYSHRQTEKDKSAPSTKDKSAPSTQDSVGITAILTLLRKDEKILD